MFIETGALVEDDALGGGAFGGSAGADAFAGGAKVKVEVKTKVEVRVNVAGGALVLEGEVHGAGEHC